jgi:glycosyltransferase involved in cell wall biosynthesis
MAGDDRRPFVSVVVPMYNEEAVVEHSLEAVVSYLGGLEDRYRFEVLVVDDGSTDTTRDMVEAFAAAHPIVRLLPHRTNFRLGQALRYAVGASRGDYIVTFDADLTYSTDHIGRLLEAIVDSGARIVIASPYMEGGETFGIPRRREFLSRAANWFLGLTALDSLTTLTGLVRAYDGPFLRTLDLKAVDVDVNTEIIYKAQVLRARIIEIPATLDWRGMEGRRRIKGINWRLYIVTLKQLLMGFLFKPFIFFMIPALLLLLLSGLAATHVTLSAIAIHDEASPLTWSESLRGSVQEEALSSLVSAVCFTLGVVLIVLTLVALQAKRYFDELFHLGTTLRRELGREGAFHRED